MGLEVRYIRTVRVLVSQSGETCEGCMCRMLMTCGKTANDTLRGISGNFLNGNDVRKVGVEIGIIEEEEGLG